MTNQQKQHQLFMDFSGLKQPNGARPSDIDMFYFGKDGMLILGEIKHEMGTFKPGQRGLYQRLADNYNGDALVLYITHNQRVEDGADSVDISKCYVQEYYWKGKWLVPQKPTTVKHIIDTNS